MTEASSVTFPVLPLRDIVVFPNMIVPLFVGREKSVRALEEVMQDDKQILLSSQKDAGEDEPTPESINETGVLANVLQLLKLPDGTVKVLVEGKQRVLITRFLDNDEYFEAEALLIPEEEDDSDLVTALSRSVTEAFEKYARLNKNVPEDALSAVQEAPDSAKLADTVAGHLGVSIQAKQELLEIASVTERLDKIYELMQAELSTPGLFQQT